MAEANTDWYRQRSLAFSTSLLADGIHFSDDIGIGDIVCRGLLANCRINSAMGTSISVSMSALAIWASSAKAEVECCRWFEHAGALFQGEVM
jgi:hypothetical protein